MTDAKVSLSGGRWYFVVTLASLGLLAWVPFVHGARRLHSRSVGRLAAIYIAITAVLGVALALTPADAEGNATGSSGEAMSVIGGLALISVMAMGCVQQATLRRQVYGPTTVVQTDPALAAALAARGKRGEARELAARDPLIARELRIGRPDLPRSYDDGGLVDLNTAPVAVIAQVCGLAQETAEAIVTGRETTSGYLTVDDVLTMVDIPVNAWDRIRDRSVVIPH
jgi:DNA uptake protein ComE-like DNA-binding protein